jgi:truncated hemoglobin YjbI
MKLIIAFIALLICVNAQSLCVKYATALGVNHATLIGLAVNGTVTCIAGDTILLDYFNGKNPVGSPNLVGNPTAFDQLKKSLVSFFGMALGCNDMSIPAYAGRNMSEAHKTSNITYLASHKFNLCLLNFLKAANFTEPDVQAVAKVLKDQQNDICKGADCGNICNKYTVPYVTNSSALVTTVVTAVVTACLADPALKPYFDGTKPAGSFDFTNPANSVRYGLLAQHLVEFFAGALGCTDGAVKTYSGLTLKVAHATMGVTKADFDNFNGKVIKAMGDLGVAAADLTAVRTVLDGTQGDVVPATPTPTTTKKASASTITILFSLLFFVVFLI